MESHHSPRPHTAPPTLSSIPSKSLSVAGRTIFVTGGGVHIATARPFRAAEASAVAISSSTEKTLRTAKKDYEAAHAEFKVLTIVAEWDSPLMAHTLDVTQYGWFLTTIHSTLLRVLNPLATAQFGAIS